MSCKHRWNAALKMVHEQFGSNLETVFFCTKCLQCRDSRGWKIAMKKYRN